MAPKTRLRWRKKRSSSRCASTRTVELNKGLPRDGDEDVGEVGRAQPDAAQPPVREGLDDARHQLVAARRGDVELIVDRLAGEAELAEPHRDLVEAIGGDGDH